MSKLAVGGNFVGGLLLGGLVTFIIIVVIIKIHLGDAYKTCNKLDDDYAFICSNVGDLYMPSMGPVDFNTLVLGEYEINK
tara:strand:+ start:597 stop:836 length:240 start_codon:yes stop_codon:yes gene_type:complete